MSNGKPYTPPPPEAVGNYKYFLIGNVTPVRIEYNTGRMCGAESFDPRGTGTLQIDHSLMSTVAKDEDVVEITREEFIAHCQTLKKNPRIGLSLHE